MKLIKLFNLTDMNNECEVRENESGGKVWEGVIGNCPMYIWKNEIASFNVEENKLVFYIEYK